MRQPQRTKDFGTRSKAVFSRAGRFPQAATHIHRAKLRSWHSSGYSQGMIANLHLETLNFLSKEMGLIRAQLAIAIGAARRERLKVELANVNQRLDLELLFYANALSA